MKGNNENQTMVQIYANCGLWGSVLSSTSTHEHLSHLKNQATLITHDLEKMILLMLNEQS